MTYTSGISRFFFFGDKADFLASPFVKYELKWLSRDDWVKILEFVSETKAEGITISQYLNEMAKVSQNMKLYQGYFNKQIT